MIASPHLRTVAVSSVAALLVAGLVAFAPTAPPARAAVPGHLPPEAETFPVSQTTEGRSSEAYLTSDGQHVAFASDATDLAPGADNGVADIFLSTALPGSTSPFSGAAVLVSAPDSARPQVPANGVSSAPVASTDGRYVAFTSAATNLTGDATAPGTQVYVRDVLLRRTFRVQGAATPDGSSSAADLSDDGRYLVFTSGAANLSPGDTNAAADGFLADLDANGDGTYGDLAITRVLAGTVVPGGVTQTVISGNGNTVVFTAGMAGLETGAAPGPVTGSFVYRWDRVWNRIHVVSEGHEPAVDATGDVIAYIKDTGCDDDPSDGLPEPFVAVSTFEDPVTYTIGAGTARVFKGLGYVAHPTVSADGSMVAWETTQPYFDFTNPPTTPLAQPVIREQAPSWWDASDSLECTGIVRADWVDVAPGIDPTLSASGRTIAYSVPAATPGAASVVATDTHSSNGLSVSSTQGELLQSGYITSIDTSKVPASQLTDYASALANAPIYRLPIYRLPIYRLPIYRLPIYRLMVSDSPIYRLPIYRLPIYRLPIYRLAVPGGWPELLAPTPFAGQLEQSVTLSDVLAWAATTLAPEATPTPTAAQIDAAHRIQGLSLDDMDLSSSGIDALSLASIVLGGAHLADIPIAGSGSDSDTNLEKWQALVKAAGIGIAVDAQTVLADVDAAGLSIGRTGVEQVALNALPVPDTLFDQLKVSDLFLDKTPLGAVDAASLNPALFTSPVSGTLAQNKAAIDPKATVADLALGAPAQVTLGTLLFSILDTPSYPWEQIDPASVQSATTSSSPGALTTNERIIGGPYFRFTFDPGPGEPTMFTAPTATITMPPATTPTDLVAAGSGPSQSWTAYSNYTGQVQIDGDRITIPLDDTPAGTMFGLLAFAPRTAMPTDGQATATLTSGTLSATKSLTVFRNLLGLDDPITDRVNGQWSDPARPGQLLAEGSVYYGWISPESIRNDDNTGERVFGPAGDENWYRVAAPPAGKRLIVSTNASDGQISMGLYAPSTGTAAAPLGAAGGGAVPGTLATEQTPASVGTAEPGADAGTPVAGQTLIDQAVGGGDGLATVESAGMDAAPGDELLIRVTSGNGKASSAMYSLRVSYIDEATEVVCTARPTAQAAPGVSDPITADTNTLYLLDTQRFTDTYGATDAGAVRTALGTMTGTGHVGSGTVQGAVLSVDSDPDVRNARSALDDNPCSMTARSKLTAAINAYVTQTISAHRDQIASVVIVGGDDMIPLAPVAQHTSQFNEASHAADLRLTSAPGRDCSAIVGVGAIDPCATPISAAAATNHILTDDPYGLATAYQSLGGYLYVPNVALGRLVETPTQIEGAISRFTADHGLVDADSTLSGGYGAWSELPEQVTTDLEWRSGANNNQLAEPWSKSTAESALFPATGQSPRIVSLNTHADETRMLAGITGAENGTFTPLDLLNASNYTTAAKQGQLAGSLLFMIGCHAGNNLPTAYYGAASADWVDVFSGAAGFVGNTGYGLANSVTTALGERLLSLYSDWVGVTVNGALISTGASLQYAKQSYLGELGLYSGYDEKALMEAVYYGLPMYTPKAVAKEKFAPLPKIPALYEVKTTTDPLGSYSSAGLSFSLPSDSFTPHTATNEQGQTVTYFTVGDDAALAVTGQPVLPKIVTQLPAAPTGLTPRGALITGLTSELSQLQPAISTSTIGVGDAGPSRTGAAFPSTFATVTQQDTPAGRVNNLVVTPGRVQTTAGGQGTMEKFTKLDLDVVYGPANPTDTTPPTFTTIEPPTNGGSGFYVTADGTGGKITKMLLLVQPEGQAGGAWTPYWMTPSGSGWQTSIAETGVVRWILQAVDASGNVAIETARGRIGIAVAGSTDALPKPELGSIGDAAHLVAGDRLLRTVTVSGAPASELTATYSVTDADGVRVGGDSAPIVTGSDGVIRTTIDTSARTPGTYTVSLEVCRATLCSTSTFQLTVDPPNTAPTATVEVTSDSETIYPTSTLTAHAVGTDPDAGDTIELFYEWFRNGVSLQQYGEILDLHGLAQPGDLISVTVSPTDGKIGGHKASAEVEVHAEPALPTITATATNDDGVYTEGWSRSAVTVAFTCTSGVAVFTCPASEHITADTKPEGTTIPGTVTDALGRTASTSILVKVDVTAPELHPTVDPATVPLNGPAPTADAGAADAASGIASQSCTAPDTSTAGVKQVTCTATDVAGNTAPDATASYTVTAPAPNAPTITATAKVGKAVYVEGTWSQGPTKVTFTCRSGVLVVQCSSPVTTSKDTGKAGVVVTGRVTDLLGRTATVQFVVKVDRTPPKLAPTVTPSTIPLGGTAVVKANATDALSGIASESCGALQTSTLGKKTVTCRATDAAGNTSTATANYSVVRPR